ncbi:MAG: anti-sigma factor antagonist [Firmicutes bacterium]|nr:anti-sigma factor antagonist [Bacillota bacterium]
MTKTDDIIKISGKIDSNNAKQFEDELIAAVDSGDVTLDGEELEYISSAGLRVLLKLKKKLGGEVSVINVSPEVYDIFDVTGFTNILSVKKALRNISVDGMEIIGKGATGIVYRMDKETIIKVFNKNVGLTMINYEGKKAKDAFIFGVPTAISYDTVKVGECYGVIYELLNAEELLSVVRNDKEHIVDHIKKYALKMQSMHRIEVDDRFGDTKEGTIERLGYLEGNVCTAEEVKKLRAVIANVPDRNTFIHGDAHIGNVMVQNGEFMFIDLSTAGKGHPIFDMVSMYIGFKMGQNLSDEAKESRELTRGFTNDEMERIWKTYLMTYLDTEDETLINKAEEQIKAVSCARIILAAISIPGLFTPQRLEYFKNTVVDYYDKGLEPICF